MDQTFAGMYAFCAVNLSPTFTNIHNDNINNNADAENESVS